MFHASPYHEGASPNHDVDDLISTGTIIARTVKACVVRGATQVYAAASHRLFVQRVFGGVQVLLRQVQVLLGPAQPFRRITECLLPQVPRGNFCAHSGPIAPVKVNGSGARPVSRTGSERASRMSAAPIAVIASARHKIGSRFERCARYRSIYRRLQHIVVQHFPLEQ
jgi:hypothetical protein